ncbi:2775_t:CDS:1, partial [Diversispora eburnea]
QFNRTLCESLARSTETVTDWNINIPSVLFVCRTAKQATTKIEPFYLIYRRPAY